MLTVAEHMDAMFQRHGLQTRRVPQGAPFETAEQFLALLAEHRPDITVCDWSPAMWIALHTWRPACRVSILRCEMLVGYERRNRFLPDKFGLESQDYVDKLNAFFLRHGSNRFVVDAREVYGGDIIVIPSVPQIDPLPRNASQHYPGATFVYTGPLLPTETERPSAELDAWLSERRSEGVPILLVTLGTVWGKNIYTAFAACFAKTDFAVVMIVPDAAERRRLRAHASPRLFVSGVTDVLDVAHKVDAVLHHAGHGTLHIALLAGKPSITLPSGEYDREDNALRLEDLGCGRHLGHDFFRNGIEPKAVASVVMRVLGSEQIKTKTSAMSRVVGEYMSTRGSAEFVRAIERHLSAAA